MAYFDSAKNQALWKKEIERMKIERENRRKNGFKPPEEKALSEEGGKERLKKGVRRINLKELERIVRKKKGLDAAGAERGSERRGHGRDYGRDRAASSNRGTERESYIPER